MIILFSKAASCMNKSNKIFFYCYTVIQIKHAINFDLLLKEMLEALKCSEMHIEINPASRLLL